MPRSSPWLPDVTFAVPAVCVSSDKRATTVRPVSGSSGRRCSMGRMSPRNPGDTVVVRRSARAPVAKDWKPARTTAVEAVRRTTLYSPGIMPGISPKGGDRRSSIATSLRELVFRSSGALRESARDLAPSAGIARVSCGATRRSWSPSPRSCSTTRPGAEGDSPAQPSLSGPPEDGEETGGYLVLRAAAVPAQPRSADRRSHFTSRTVRARRLFTAAAQMSQVPLGNAHTTAGAADAHHRIGRVVLPRDLQPRPPLPTPPHRHSHRHLVTHTTPTPLHPDE